MAGAFLPCGCLVRNVLIFAAFFAACGEASVQGEGEGELSTARIIEEGTPQAIGVLAMLNDSGTTLTILDVDADLDARAAKNLIAHRDGKDGRFGTSDDDRFDTIDEVDAVAYVGDSALQKLLTYAIDNDWIPSGDDYYGSIEGVEFTTTEAAGVVALCNSASVQTLDVDVDLDSRAATGIVAKRPFTTVEQVAAVSYVGATALTHLRDYAKAHPGTVMSTSAAVSTLTAATPGLLFPSESDFPLTVFVIPGGGSTPVTADNIKSLLASDYANRPDEPTLDQRVVETWTIPTLFDRFTIPQDWWEDNNRADQPKWQQIRDVYEHGLSKSQVFRLGAQETVGANHWLVGSIDVFVVGTSAEGDLVVIETISVET